MFAVLLLVLFSQVIQILITMLDAFVICKFLKLLIIYIFELYKYTNNDVYCLHNQLCECVLRSFIPNWGLEEDSRPHRGCCCSGWWSWRWIFSGAFIHISFYSIFAKEITNFLNVFFYCYFFEKNSLFCLGKFFLYMQVIIFYSLNYLS